MLDTASAWLDSTLQASEGVDIAYSLGHESVDITAVPGQTPLGFDLGNGILQSWQSQDWLIAVADLVNDEVPIIPREGHRVSRTISGRTISFEVQQADDGRCFRYTDSARQTLRVHSREVL